ncbi:wings apart-like protein regulation of heterochromatin-domain-containing protein [Neocallimastix sp. 'constans']
MNTTPNKVKITYGSKNSKYYKGSRIKNNVISNMPSIQSKKEISNADSKLKKDVFDFNPDHDDFEIRQLQRQRQRLNLTSGNKLHVVKKQPNSSIIKSNSVSSLDITSPVKVKRIIGVSTKKSSSIQLNKKNIKDKKKENSKSKETNYLKSNIKRNSKRNNRIDINKNKEKSLVNNKEIADVKDKSKTNNVEESKLKHARTNSLDSTSSLTSLSSLPYSSVINAKKAIGMKKSMSVSDYNRIKRQRISESLPQNNFQTRQLLSQSIRSNDQNNSFQRNINIYDRNNFEINNSNIETDTMLDLESNNYIVEELEDTFTSSTPIIPRTTSSTINDEKILSDTSLSSDDDDDNDDNKFHILSTSSSVNKSQMSSLPESRIRRMKSLKKSKSFGTIYDSSTSHGFHDDDNSVTSNIKKLESKYGNDKGEDDESDTNSPNSLKKSISSLSYFSEDNKSDKKSDQVINSEIKLLDGSSVNVPILFYKKKKKRLGHDGDVSSALAGGDEGDSKSNHFYKKTYQSNGSLVKNDDPYEGPYVAMSKMFEDSEESEEEDIDSVNKKKKVKSLFELKELGENKKFKDEIDYLLDGLSEKQTTTAKRLSCIDLCKKLSESDFILNLRAYGYIPQLYKILSNEKDKIIQLCLIYFIYTLFQDEGSLEIIVQENNCLPLLIKFLRIKDDYINIDKLKNTKEKICMKEIKKVIEESEYFENTTISFQLISIKCLIQLLDPSSSVDIKNDLKQMFFTNDFSDNNILSSPTVSSSLTCVEIMTNRLKIYTNYFEKTYQQWKSDVESQIKNIPFLINYEYLENITSCLKLFELLNKENELELPLAIKSKISTLIIQLLNQFITIIYNDHEIIDDSCSQFLLNCIKVLINFFNEAKDADIRASKHTKNHDFSSMNILTDEQYSELFRILLIYIDQFSPLLEENKQMKLQDIFLLIIGLLINATEYNEKCRILIADQHLGKACSYSQKPKKNKWCPCRFNCLCPPEESKGFLEIIVEIYSNIVKTENYILASYLAIFIGFLCLHPENKSVVKKYLFENSFSTIIQILEQFIQLNTLSQQFSSPTIGFNPSSFSSGLINGGGNHNSSLGIGLGELGSPTGTPPSVDFPTLSLPMGQPESGLDLGLINGPGITSLSIKKDNRTNRDTTTDSFLKVIEILKQE